MKGCLKKWGGPEIPLSVHSQHNSLVHSDYKPLPCAKQYKQCAVSAPVQLSLVEKTSNQRTTARPHHHLTMWSPYLASQAMAAATRKASPLSTVNQAIVSLEELSPQSVPQ